MTNERDYFIMANEEGDSLDYVQAFNAYKAFVDKNPFGLKRDSPLAGYTWKGNDGRTLHTSPDAYGAEVSLTNFTDEDGKAVLEYLAHGLKEQFLQRNVRIIPIGDTNSYILKEPDDLSAAEFEKKVNQAANAFGFTNTYFGGTWTWVTEAGSVFALTPETPGIELSFWNTPEEIATAMAHLIASTTGTPVMAI